LGTGKEALETLFTATDWGKFAARLGRTSLTFRQPAGRWHWRVPGASGAA